MRIFDDFWWIILVAGVCGLIAGAWGKLDKKRPELSMALNLAFGVAILVAIVALLLPIFWRKP